jgi:hypothetical protein
VRRRLHRTLCIAAASIIAMLIVMTGGPSAGASTSSSSSTAGAAKAASTTKPASHATPPFAVQRAIVLSKAMVEQVANGAIVATHRLTAEQPYTLPQVASMVNDPTWLANTAPGVYLLKAALIAGPGTSLRVSSPAVTSVRLAYGQGAGVFIGGEAAWALFDGVSVTSWNVLTGAPEATPALGRPFILFQNKSSLWFMNTRVSDLGSAQVGASGVTWKSDPAPGVTTGSTFTGNQDGIEVLHSGSILITRSQFDSNHQNGVRIADASTAPQISTSSADSNGTTGFDMEQAVGPFRLTDDTADHDVTGILLQHTSGTASVSGSHVAGNTSVGVAVRDASGVNLTSTHTSSNRIGVELSDSTYKARINGLMSTRDRVGLEVHDSYVPQLRGITIHAARRIGIIADSQRLSIQHAAISSTPVGVEARNTTSIGSSTISRGMRGLAVWPHETITLTDTTVRARHIGIELASGASAYVLRSSITAPEATRGGHTRSLSSNISQAKVSILFLVPGAGLLLLCVLLEMFMTYRQRRDPGPAVPRHLWNIT